MLEERDRLREIRLKTSRTGGSGAKVTSKEVAQRYDGGDNSTNTAVKQAVSVAKLLTWKTIGVIGSITYMESADVIIQSPDLNKYSLSSQSEALSHQDFRPFNSFVCFEALRDVKTFMAAAKNGHEEAQEAV